MADADEIMRDFLKSIALEQRYDEEQVTLTLLSGLSGNLTTRLYRATITSPSRADLKLFIKVAGFSEAMREHAFQSFYLTERIFYTQIARTYDWLQDKHNINGNDRLVFPKCYGCNPRYTQETVVLEDLESSGLHCWNLSDPVDWKYASKAVEELAKFHALSLAYGVEDPEASRKLLADMKYIPPADMEILKGFTQGSIQAAKEVIADELKEKFVKFMEEHGDVSVSKYYKPILRPVLRHGDYKISNLLYKRCRDGKLQLTIVDYQTLQTGCGVVDLMIFIFSGTDQEFRRRHFHQLTELYYQQLSAALKRFGVGSDVYPREDFDYELKAVLPYGLVVAVYFLPALLVSPDQAPTLDEETSFQDLVVKPSGRYKERLEGVIADFVEWGLF